MNNLLQNYESYLNFINNGSFDEANLIFTNHYLDNYDQYGLKPIHWACMSFNVDILKLLLEKNSDIETRSTTGWRPIHFATYFGDENMIKLLIEKYCKLNCKTDNGETVLNVFEGKCEQAFFDEILRKTNLRIGLSMELHCGRECHHRFCLRSLIHGNFSKENMICQGLSAFIYEVEDLQSNRKFVVKTISKYDLSIQSKLILPNNEFLSRLKHSKIIKYYGAMETPNNELNVFMELMVDGTLYDKIESVKVITMESIRRYCRDILKAVEFLHENKMLHSNINARKILIDKNDGCKLIISSSSCFLRDGNDKLNIFYWTPIYQAPEIINDKSWSYPYDIWCVACTVAHMLTGISPSFSKLHVLDMINKIKEKFTNIFRKFFDKMMIEDPIQRATANVLIKHKFLSSIPSYNVEDNHPLQLNNQSFIYGSLINRNDCTDIIQNSVNNNQIGLSMGLNCEMNCKHRFCLSSVTAFNFEKGEKIDTGAAGKVYKLPLIFEKQWAVKIIKNINTAFMKNEIKYFENDINQYREIIKHPNIVKYFGAVKNMERIAIFMELIDGESLYTKINRNGFIPLSLKTIKQYTKQILEGLKFLHDKKIIHRDIKSQNIMISKENIIKIADFGLSRILRTISLHQKRTFCGTPNYVAPEVINGDSYDWSADIWSLGATVFEMASGHPPYHESEAVTVIFKIGNIKKMEYPSNIGSEVINFLNLMMLTDPQNRYNAESLLFCDFLKE